MLKYGAGALHDDSGTKHRNEFCITVCIGLDCRDRPFYFVIKNNSLCNTGNAIIVNSAFDQNNHANAKIVLGSNFTIHNDGGSGRIKFDTIDKNGSKTVNRAPANGHTRTTDSR